MLDLDWVIGFLLWLRGLLGGSSTNSVSVSDLLSIAVLAPLVVVGAHFPGPLLIFVLLSLNEVVRLAIAAVFVGTMRLLGPFIAIETFRSSSLGFRSSG